MLGLSRNPKEKGHYWSRDNATVLLELCTALVLDAQTIMLEVAQKAQTQTVGA